MAKGRKNATVRNDRLLLGTTYDHDHDHDPGGRSVGPELDHDDVWQTAEPDRPVRAGVGRLGGLSLSFETAAAGGGGDRALVHWRHQRRHVGGATSAPVDVPNRSRTGRAGSPEGSAVDDEETDWVPPHEYLAREHGRSVTTSVFEGAGRTLKGRDLSRVRDAVWRQTGFFG